MISSLGIIEYRDNYWVWLLVDDQLGKYLRKLYYLARKRCYKLGSPSQGEHITVVSSHEYNRNFDRFWYKHNRRPITFEILFPPLTNGNAWWYTIKSKDLEEIRGELGLPKQCEFAELHYCPGYERIGKDYEQ